MFSKDSLFYFSVFSLALKLALFGAAEGSFAAEPSSSIQAEVDFFRPSEPQRYEARLGEKARAIFFIAPGCRSCPEEAAKFEMELKRLGVNYAMEGLFLGNPAQVGEYLTEIGSYPFNFELGVDIDGTITKGYGVKTVPSAVIERGGKRVIVTRASELKEKLR